MLQKISSAFNRNIEFIAFIGLWCWLSVTHVHENEKGSWIYYGITLLVLLPTQMPGLVYYWKSKNIDSKTWHFWRKWAFFFLILLPFLTTMVVYWAPFNYNAWFFINAALSSFSLAVLIMVNNLFYDKAQNSKWVQKIGLEKAVLVTIILLACVLAAMAVSSLGNPEFDKPDNLLIGFVFKPKHLLLYFWSFCSIAAQLLVMYLSGYFIFLFNSRILVSKVLKQRGIILYIISALAFVGIIFPLLAQLLIALPLNEMFGRDIFGYNPFDLENGFGALLIIFLSLPIVLALQWGQQNIRILALENEKSQTELSLLKQQINPHFFFNTLNNLYALSLQKDTRTSESILQLSELMRFTIYKGQEDRILLTEEVKYLEDYIELQQMRLRIPLKLSFEKEILNDNFLIAPMLLIVIIENAFKHGIETADQEAFLHISLKVSNHQLEFTCINSVENKLEDHKPGIGLQNLRSRLDLIYPNNYKLVLNKEPGIFKAMLHINLI